MKKFVLHHRVRWHETDAAGVVYFGSYLTYIEMAEVELYRSLGISLGVWMKKEGISLPRVEVFCQYKSPARYDDLLEIQAWAELKGKAIIIHGEIYREGENKLLARGYLKSLGVQRTEEGYGKAVEVPAALADYLRPYTVSTGNQ